MLPLFLALAQATDPASITVTALPPAAIAAPRLSDAQLASLRGGVQLPNGLMLTLGIDIQTRIDGLLALHTVYVSDGANAGVRVFTDGAAPVAGPPPTTAVPAGTVSSAPVLTVDRSPTGTTIIPGTTTTTTAVNLLASGPETWPAGVGEIEVPVTADGPAVPIRDGEVRLSAAAGGAVVTLSGGDLTVQQLVGRSTGVVVANTASNRAIDTVSAINVDLQGLSAGALGGLFAVQRVAMELLINR